MSYVTSVVQAYELNRAPYNRSTIERMNEYAPQHSRIFKEVYKLPAWTEHGAHTTSYQMILIATPSKLFHLTAKGTLRRNLILSDYEDEIEAIYQAVETSAESDIPPPTTWDEDGIKTFVRAVVHDTLNRAIEDDADIFRNGGDRYVFTSTVRCA